MTPYVSIRDEVLAKLEAALPEIQERFGVETIGIFGSVSRGEDTEKSDVDFVYRFREGVRMYHSLLNLGDYLEEMFGRKVDLVSADWIDPLIRPYIEEDVIVLCGSMAPRTDRFGNLIHEGRKGEV